MVVVAVVVVVGVLTAEVVVVVVVVVVAAVPVRSGLIDLLLVTCNPVLPTSGSSSWRLKRHPHHFSQGRL